MFQLMSIKCSLVSGCKSTNFALVRFLSRVKSAMFTKVLWRGKRFITDLTGIRFLSRVNSASLGPGLTGDPWQSPVGIATLRPCLPGASPPRGLGFASLGILGHPLSALPPWGLFREGGVHILDIFLSLSSSFRGRGCLPLPFPWGWVGFGSWTLGNQSLTG